MCRDARETLRGRTSRRGSTGARRACRGGRWCRQSRITRGLARGRSKPIEYVKVCSIYGAGFFYIPGTDTCIKIGGWVRFEMDFNAGGSHNPANNGGNGRNNRIEPST